jgi:hypothetical protein
MPENGTGRLDDHEQRIARPEAARRELEDSFIVMKFIAREQAAVEAHNQKMSEFDDKLNALIAIVSRMQGGMESRPS